MTLDALERLGRGRGRRSKERGQDGHGHETKTLLHCSLVVQIIFINHYLLKIMNQHSVYNEIIKSYDLKKV